LHRPSALTTTTSISGRLRQPDGDTVWVAAHRLALPWDPYQRFDQYIATAHAEAMPGRTSPCARAEATPPIVQRPDRHPGLPAAPPGGRVQARDREPADLAYRRGLIPRRAVQQPLRPVRGSVARVLGDRPPVPLRQLADQRRQVLPRLLPRPGPGEARPQPPQQLDPLPSAQPGPYPDNSSRLRLICSHKQ
jgi:hypothetical protein